MRITLRINVRLVLEANQKKQAKKVGIIQFSYKVVIVKVIGFALCTNVAITIGFHGIRKRHCRSFLHG